MQALLAPAQYCARVNEEYSMKRACYRSLIVAATCTLVAPRCWSDPLLSPAQALAYVRIGDLHFSPDGSKLAYVVGSYQWDALPRLRITIVDTGETSEITPPLKAERSPQWAPDGKTLAFLSNRGGKQQVYLMPVASGDPAPLTASKFGVEKFHWSPDGRQIAYLAKDDAAPDSEEGPQVADRGDDLSRLWIITVSSGTKRSVGGTGYRIEDFQWQDLAHLLVSAADRPREEEFNDHIYRVATNDGQFTLVANPAQPFDSLSVSPNGKQFAVRSTGANGPIERDLFVGTLDSQALRNISAPTGLAVADVRWHEPRAAWLLSIDGFRNRIFRITPGAAPQRIELQLSVAAFDVSHEGFIAFVGEDFAHLPEIYIRRKNGDVRQLSHIQQGWNGISLASTAIFRTASSDGLLIEAALMKPAIGAKLPLVLLVHGGPSANFTAGYGWETAWAQLLAAHGYQVLMVNPRGSNGYSEDFLKANRGDWGGGDYRDLLTVLDAVVAQGQTDPERLGIGGWSYGGEMAAWAITQTNRFKAAVFGAGVFDQAAEFETENNPADDEWYFGTPWEHPDVFARNSPSTYVRNAHTPTLILAGDKDANNPVGQSKGFYRALKHFGVESEMVIYPGEGHSPRRCASNIDMFERILGWYDRYLKPEK
jgi:dipeptidyl aminopeptidase/acylaminoacyl peptidase